MNGRPIRVAVNGWGRAPDQVEAMKRAVEAGLGVTLRWSSLALSWSGTGRAVLPPGPEDRSALDIAEAAWSVAGFVPVVVELEAGDGRGRRRIAFDRRAYETVHGRAA